MNLADKKKREIWLRSQIRWHGARNGAWHIKQYRWFKKQLRHLYTISEIIVSTFHRHAKEIAENVSVRNALFRHIKANTEKTA